MDIQYQNPTMRVGVEYRTTERWQGKAVYTMLVDMGVCPNNSYKTIFFAETTQVIRCAGQLSNGYSLPYETYYNQIHYWVNITATTWGIILNSNCDVSDVTATVQVWYVKD